MTLAIAHGFSPRIEAWKNRSLDRSLSKAPAIIKESVGGDGLMHSTYYASTDTIVKKDDKDDKNDIVITIDGREEFSKLQQKYEGRIKLFKNSLLVFDLLTIVAALSIGILGLKNAFLPSQASYACLGGAALIGAADLTAGCCSKKGKKPSPDLQSDTGSPLFRHTVFYPQ